MSGVKGYGGGGGQGSGGGGGKVDICQDSCEPVNPCQNVSPVPAQCKETVDPCQENQSGGIGGGGIGGGYGGVIGGQGGLVGQDCQGDQGSQVSCGGVGIKK